MIRKKASKLQLNRETLKNLRAEQLGQVAGGFVKDYTGYTCNTDLDCTEIGCNTYRCSFYC